MVFGYINVARNLFIRDNSPLRELGLGKTNKKLFTLCIIKRRSEDRTRHPGVLVDGEPTDTRTGRSETTDHGL